MGASTYDEYCDYCGGTDAIGNTVLEWPCSGNHVYQYTVDEIHALLKEQKKRLSESIKKAFDKI